MVKEKYLQVCGQTCKNTSHGEKLTVNQAKREKNVEIIFI